MKCSKCGNEMAWVGQSTQYDMYSCSNCGSYKNIKRVITQPAPTTAEMWEWLGRNFSVTFLHRDGQNDYLEIAHGFWNNVTEENGFDACVRAAYTEAKKQEAHRENDT